MVNKITDEIIDYVGKLAKLKISDDEKEQTRKDMQTIMDYIDILNELDTRKVEPMFYIFPVHNVFREDVITNGDDKAHMLANAPKQKDGQYQVPKTVE